MIWPILKRILLAIVVRTSYRSYKVSQEDTWILREISSHLIPQHLDEMYVLFVHEDTKTAD